MSRIPRTKVPSSPPRSGPRADLRLRALLCTVAAIVALGAALRYDWGSTDAQARWGDAVDRSPEQHAATARNREVKARFDQAVIMLHGRQYEHAVAALHRVIELEPTLAEAHVNMGYALLGLGRHGAARDFFEGATALRPGQANAYYGLAVALEAGGDLAGATGAMRTFVHLSPPDDPFVRKARAALWEWQQGATTATAPSSAPR